MRLLKIQIETKKETQDYTCANMIIEIKHSLKHGIYTTTSEFTQEKNPTTVKFEESHLIRNLTWANTELSTQN